MKSTRRKAEKPARDSSHDGWLAPRTGGYTPSNTVSGPPPPGPGAASRSSSEKVAATAGAARA